jgi:hypothetical protein
MCFIRYNNISNKYVSRYFIRFYRSGASLTNLNASNVSLGTLSISRGGIGTTTLTANQILIGNATTSILQSPNLTWNNTSNTLSAFSFIGNGSQLTSLNASNVSLGLELRCRPSAFMSSHMFALLSARRLKAQADADAHREFKAFAPRDHTKPSIDRTKQIN